MDRVVSPLCIWAAVSLLAPAAASRADDAAEQARRSNSVTIRGCLRGTVLTALKSAQSKEPAERYELAGHARFLEVLKEHTGHTEEATGPLKASNAGGVPDSTAKPVDKAGATNPSSSRSAGKVIDVTGMTHVSNKCP